MSTQQIASSVPATLLHAQTPALVLDKGRLQQNCERMQARAETLNVTLRPHMKTAKSLAVARIATGGLSGAITVSTLREAEYFATRGFKDITYAIGITPDKLPRVGELIRGGTVVGVLTDDAGVAAAIADFAEEHGVSMVVYIEVDVGYHRAGVSPEEPRLLEVARALAGSSRVELRGVLAHAGHSYASATREELLAAVEEERSTLVRAAERLREAGFACPVVSAGSTPTMMTAESLEGITEIRPGNYMFFDLFQAGLGTCALEDIAVSVLATVNGHMPTFSRALIDAGGLALSKDTSAEDTMPGIGYGVVCDAATCEPLEDVCVATTSQEHGWLQRAKDPATFPYDLLPVGTKVRVLPNHSCMTAAAYEEYLVVDGDDCIIDVWDRVNGW